MQLGKPMCNVHVNYLMPRMHVTRQADHWLKDKLVAFPRNRSHDHVQRVNSSLIFPVSKSMPSKILLFLTRHIHNAYLVQIKALNHASLIELVLPEVSLHWVWQSCYDIFLSIYTNPSTVEIFSGRRGSHVPLSLALYYTTGSKHC